MILEAALNRFSTSGWAATTLTAIAKDAGVSVDAIYAGFGTKSALLLEVVEIALVGDDEPARMVERADFALLGDGDFDERVRAAVRYTMTTYARATATLAALREAGASDPAARERSERFDQDRYELMASGMSLVMGVDAPDAVTDIVWALVSPEVFVHLYEGRGWTWGRLENFFVEIAQSAISSAR